MRNSVSRGFTLVELMVVSPIVILLIGAFIGLIVNLTGEVMSSRGSNMLAYDVQNALNRIEQDVKLSTTFLAVNNIDVSSTKQGYGMSKSAGGTTNFTNIDKTASGGTNASLILNELATLTNPLAGDGPIYLRNKPHPCSDIAIYSQNTPMTYNVVYFVDANNTLWRRVIMPPDYDDMSVHCFGMPPYQIPSCINGYNPATLPFCKSNDERMVDGVSPNDFIFNYYTTASSTSPDPIASNPETTNDAVRNTALQSTPTVRVSITSKKTIAGRDISRTGTLSVTRLDVNASSIAQITPVTEAPSAPTVSGTVSDGHKVTFTWPRVAGATSYDVDYRINGDDWTTGGTELDNNNRSYVVTSATHTDTVEVRVTAHNTFGPSSYGTKSITIPLWAPLILRGDWTDYSNSYNSAAYTKTKAGLVMLKGLVKNASSPSAGDIIGSLPSDYRPSGRLIFGTSTSSNTTARVDVNPVGDIVMSTSGNGAWFSLESIRYIPAETNLTRTYPALQNGWVNYGDAYSPAAYIQDSTGRVTIEGLIKSGSVANAAVIFSLPTSVQPPKSQLFHTRSSAFAHLNVTSGTGLEARNSGTNGFISINTSYLPSSYTNWSNLSLQGGWVAYNTTFYNSAQYTKTSDNVVHLRGLIKSGSTTYDSTIATLPAGFRPKSRMILTTVSNHDYSRLDILPSGTIEFMGTSNAWHSFEGISFIAEQ